MPKICFIGGKRLKNGGSFRTLEFLFDNLLVSLARELLSVKLFELNLTSDKSFWCGPKMVGSEEVRYHVPEIIISQFHHILALNFTCKVFKIL